MTTSRTARAKRSRGRPPNSDGRATALRLLDAATEVCAEYGFEGTTLALVADRAGVSPTAIYNHFDDRDDLLYAAAVRGVERITDLAERAAADDKPFAALADAYLRPDMRLTRRVILELEMASSRHPRLGELMDSWHAEMAQRVAELLPDSRAVALAKAKIMFMLLLGLCHLDDLSSIKGSSATVQRLAENLISSMVTDAG